MDQHLADMQSKLGNAQAWIKTLEEKLEVTMVERDQEVIR